jgi:hypothetical protein
MSTSQPPSTSLEVPVPKFDQIVKGNVIIKKLSKYKYKITFSKIGNFLMYQVWDKDNVNNMNDKRIVGYLSAKEWVNGYKIYNERLEKDDKPLFTPTTIMETADEDAYAFVIHKAYINSHDKVVFTVSTKEISLQNKTSNNLIKIPCGKFINMRFDIDFWEITPITQQKAKYTNCVQYYSKLIPNSSSFFLGSFVNEVAYNEIVDKCWEFYCTDPNTPCGDPW